MLFRRQPPSDAQLVQAVLRGDKQKFATLVDRYRNLVYASILARVPNIDDADDLSQETFLKAFHRLGTLHDPRKFGPWARRIADNLAINLRRSRAADEQALLSVAPPELDPTDRAYEQQEEERIVWEVISRLPDELRQVILLFYIEDYSREQVAHFLDVSIEAVKTRLRRARERLRGDLEGALEHKARDVVRRKRRGKDFTRKVMAGLPLALWTLPRPPVFWTRFGWGLHVAVTGLLGIGLWGLISGWWPVPDRQPEGNETGRPVAYVRLASTEEYLRFVDRTRFPRTLEDTPSIFGSAPLGQEAMRQQELALRGGLDGRLKWTFDTDPEGWQARMVDYVLPVDLRLPAEVRGGVLCIPLPTPESHKGGVQQVELISPEIGYDCRLFDDLEMRVRIRYDRGVTGRIRATWTTPRNRQFPGFEPATFNGGRYSRFANWLEDGIAFAPQWQDIAFEHLHERRELAWLNRDVPRPELSWDGQLVDLRLGLYIGEADLDVGPPPATYPTAIEIDRIVLQGAAPAMEMPLPAAAPPGPTGSWLGRARFYSLNQRGLEWPHCGDLDGDGDLDLVVAYSQRHPIGTKAERGLIVAYNDGHGRFASGEPQLLVEGGTGPRIAVADMDGDGLVDAIVSHGGGDTRILTNSGEGYFEVGTTFQDELLVGAADVDGDGDVDLATGTHPRDVPGPWPPWIARVRLNDGSSGFDIHDLPAPGPERWYTPQMADYDGDGRAELIWAWYAMEAAEAHVRIYSDFDGHDWRSRSATRFELPDLARTHRFFSGITCVADLDNDGDLDLGTPAGLFQSGVAHRSMALGTIVRAVGMHDVSARPWLPRSVHLHHPPFSFPEIAPQTQDLDGDGLADPVFADLNHRRGPCLLTLRGQRGALPVEEGRYLVPGWPRGWTCGDIDGDGRTDVVAVVARSSGDGVCVLRNVSGPSTAAALGPMGR